MSPVKKIVAVGHHRELYYVEDKTVPEDLKCGMNNEEKLDFGRYITSRVSV